MIEWLKTSCSPLYKFLLWIYKKTPFYSSGLKKEINERQSREAVFLGELFHKELFIQSGPFKGLKYLKEASGSVLLPKLLGTYEQNLHIWIEEAILVNYDVLIDIGCAEGYYAVGLAFACPNLEVLAYDLNPQARKLCIQLAELNTVKERVRVKQECGKDEIEQHSGERVLIICDIEGGEIDLLDPDKIPALTTCDLIVEAHDFLTPGITSKLIERFQNTHTIDTIGLPSTTKPDIQKIAHLPPKDKQFILDEQRHPEQVWHRFLANRQ